MAPVRRKYGVDLFKHFFMKPSLFCVVTRLRFVVVLYRRFGTTCLSFKGRVQSKKIFQKREDLICTAAEISNHSLFMKIAVASLVLSSTVYINVKMSASNSGVVLCLPCIGMS